MFQFITFSIVEWFIMSFLYNSCIHIFYHHTHATICIFLSLYTGTVVILFMFALTVLVNFELYLSFQLKQFSKFQERNCLKKKSHNRCKIWIFMHIIMLSILVACKLHAVESFIIFMFSTNYNHYPWRSQTVEDIYRHFKYHKLTDYSTLCCCPLLYSSKHYIYIKDQKW